MLIEEAHENGARYSKACGVVGISHRTLQRWKRCGVRDNRKGAKKRVIRKLSTSCRREIVAQCNSERFQDLNPHEIVPMLLNEGRYLGSVSTFYRVLKAENLVHHRSNTKPRNGCGKPQEQLATASDQVYCWDITWLPGPVAGSFFYLYLILDIFSRKIVGWEVHERESAELAATLVRQAVLAEGCTLRPLVLHADNGSPMKGATMKVTMEKLGITASYSRPRVSNDNPFSEALFRTCKYRPDWPNKGFATKADAQAWVKSFASWYNGQHLHSAIRFVTPDARDRKSVV